MEAAGVQRKKHMVIARCLVVRHFECKDGEKTYFLTKMLKIFEASLRSTRHEC